MRVYPYREIQVVVSSFANFCHSFSPMFCYFFLFKMGVLIGKLVN